MRSSLGKCCRTNLSILNPCCKLLSHVCPQYHSGTGLRSGMSAWRQVHLPYHQRSMMRAYLSTVKRTPDTKKLDQLNAASNCCRAHSSTVKRMPDTKKQDQLNAAEESGKFEPAAERYESILGSLRSTAEKKMSKAIDATQNDLSKMQAAGKTQEDRSVTMKEANKVAEKGRIAVRNVRRDLMQKIGRLADYERDISQGDKECMDKDIQQVTDSFIEQIGDIVQQRVGKLHSVSDQ